MRARKTGPQRPGMRAATPPLHGHNAQRNAILRWRFLRQGHHRRIACVTSITLRPSATVMGHPDPPGIRRPGRCSRLLRSRVTVTRVCNWSTTAAPAPAVLLARVDAPCSMPELFPCPSCAHPMRARRAVVVVAEAASHGWND